jgi:carboxyl-terminal processing protease
MEDMNRLRKRLDENRISLNEDTRKAELNEDKVRKETRAQERLARHDEEMQMIRLTLDNVDKPNLQPIIFPGKLAANKKNGSNKVAPEAAEDADSDTPSNDDGTKEPAIDPERDETLNILKDLVDLNLAPTTASTTASPPPPPN